MSSVGKLLLLTVCGVVAIGVGYTRPVAAVEVHGSYVSDGVLDPDDDDDDDDDIGFIIGDLLVPPEPTYYIGYVCFIGPALGIMGQNDPFTAHPGNALD